MSKDSNINFNSIKVRLEQYSRLPLDRFNGFQFQKVRIFYK